MAMAQVIISICDDCDDLEAIWFCEGCRQEICEDCKSNSHRDHPCCDLHERQTLLHSFCPKKNHGKRKMDLYCRDCKLQICSTCMRIEHSAHRVCSYEEEVAECKTKIKGQIEKLTERKEAIRSEKRKSINESQCVIDVMKEQKDQLVKMKQEVLNMVEKMFQEKMEKLKQSVKTTQVKQKKFVNECKTDINHVKNGIRNLYSIQKSDHLIMIQKELNESDDVLRREVLTYNNPEMQHFEISAVTEEDLKPVFCKIKESTASREKQTVLIENYKKQFVLDDKPKIIQMPSPQPLSVNSLLVSKDGKYLWIVYLQEKSIHKLDMKGRPIFQSLELQNEISCISHSFCDGVFLGSESTIYEVSDANGEKITFYHEQNKADMENIKIKCMTHQTKEKALLAISMKGDSDTYNESSLLVLDEKGVVLKKVSLLLNNGKLLFQDPMRVACTSKGFVGVIDTGIKFEKTLKIMPNLNSLDLTTFSGKIGSTNPKYINISDLEPNDESSFLVFDRHNHLYVIDGHGDGYEYIENMKSKFDKNPCSIACHGSNNSSDRKVIFGCQDGSIIIMDGVKPLCPRQPPPSSPMPIIKV